EGLALAELGSADADAQAVADLILVVEQVDDVEAQLRSLAEADRYALHERGVDGGVVRQRRIVGGDDGGAKAAAKQDIGRDLGRPLGLGIEGVRRAARKGPALCVVEDDEMVGDVGKFVRAKIELGRIDVSADAVAESAVEI